jgi:ATP-dependent DNA ligase
LVFRDKQKVELQSKAGRPLTRYFPELVNVILELKADKFLLDGEIVVPSGNAFSFDACSSASIRLPAGYKSSRLKSFSICWSTRMAHSSRVSP